MKSRLHIVNKALSVSAGALAVLCVSAAAPGASERAVRPLAVEMGNECDRLAGSPYDNLRNKAYAPVEIDEIDAAPAMNACGMAFRTTHNPRYSFQLGRALNKAQRMEEATGAYDAAVEAGYPAAKVNLGMLMGRLGDLASEFKLYGEAAAGGNMLAAYNLGVAYRDGLGTERDVHQALRWFETAAAAGDDTAAFNIGVIYDEGQLVAQDDQTAIAWYDLAAQRGNADAMINLGIMYETGEGIPSNAAKAAEMYASAAERGDVFGAHKLMEMHQAGTLPSPPSVDQAMDQDLEGLVLKEGDMNMPMTISREI